MAALARQTTFTPELRQYVNSLRIPSRVIAAGIPNKSSSSFPILRLNGMPLLAAPTSAWRLQVPNDLDRDGVRERLHDRSFRGAWTINGGQLLAFGDRAVLEDATGATAERVGIDPLAESAPTPERALIYEAITRALARALPCWPMVRDRGHRLIVRSEPDLARHHAAVRALETAYGDALIGLAPTDLGVDQHGQRREFAEALNLSLEWRLGHLWLVFGPHTWLTAQAKAPDTKPVGDKASAWRKERWVERRNERWASIIDCWAALLAPQAETVIDMQLDGSEGSESISGQFVLAKWTAHSRGSRR